MPPRSSAASANRPRWPRMKAVMNPNRSAGADLDVEQLRGAQRQVGLLQVRRHPLPEVHRADDALGRDEQLVQQRDAGGVGGLTVGLDRDALLDCRCRARSASAGSRQAAPPSPGSWPAARRTRPARPSGCGRVRRSAASGRRLPWWAGRTCRGPSAPRGRRPGRAKTASAPSGRRAPPCSGTCRCSCCRARSRWCCRYRPGPTSRSPKWRVPPVSVAIWLRAV